MPVRLLIQIACVLTTATSTTAFAQTPPKHAFLAVQDVFIESERPVLKVRNPLSLSVFEDSQTGAEATVSFEPNFHPGCKVKLTWHF